VRSKIEQTIGREAMAKLIAEFGGQQLYIPRLRRLEAEEVDEIRNLAAAGSTPNELARKLGVTTRFVYKILRRPR
jgi:Mor family transcriptional regulator